MSDAVERARTLALEATEQQKLAKAAAKYWDEVPAAELGTDGTQAQSAAKAWSSAADTYAASVAALEEAAWRYKQAREQNSDEADANTNLKNAQNAYRAANVLFEQQAGAEKQARDDARKAYEGQPALADPIRAKKAAAAVVKSTAADLERAKAADTPDAVEQAMQKEADAAAKWQKAAKAWVDAPKAAEKKDANEAASKAYTKAKSERETQQAAAKGIKEPAYNSEHFFMTSGVVSLAPYKIKDTDSTNATNLDGSPVTDGAGTPLPPGAKVFFLDDSSDVDVLAYFEFRYRSRLAWNRARLDSSMRNAEKGWFFWCDQERSPEPGFLDSFNGQCLLPSDVDMRAGVTFGTGGNVSGSTVAGSGDFNADIGLGWPLFHRDFEWGEIHSTHAFSLETGFEAVTERSVQDVHKRITIGLSYAVGMLGPPLGLPGVTNANLKKRVYEFSFRGGANWMEFPDTLPHSMDMLVTDSNGNVNRRERVKGSTDPNFTTEWQPGLDVDVQLPFGRTSYLTMGAGVFGGDPNPWFLRLGMTLPIDAIIGVFTSVGE